LTEFEKIILAGSKTGWKADKLEGRQAGRQTGRKADRQEGRQAGRQTSRPAARLADW